MSAGLVNHYRMAYWQMRRFDVVIRTYQSYPLKFASFEIGSAKQQSRRLC